MKKSTILYLLDGIREELHQPRIVDKAQEDMCNHYDELEKKLSAELFEVLKKYEFELATSWFEEMNFYMKESFKLGLRVGLECGED